MRSWYSDTNTKCPLNISSPEYKPPKKCLLYKPRAYIWDFTVLPPVYWKITPCILKYYPLYIERLPPVHWKITPCILKDYPLYIEILPPVYWNITPCLFTYTIQNPMHLKSLYIHKLPPVYSQTTLCIFTNYPLYIHLLPPVYWNIIPSISKYDIYWNITPCTFKYYPLEFQILLYIHKLPPVYSQNTSCIFTKYPLYIPKLPPVYSNTNILYIQTLQHIHLLSPINSLQYIEILLPVYSNTTPFVLYINILPPEFQILPAEYSNIILCIFTYYPLNI